MGVLHQGSLPLIIYEVWIRAVFEQERHNGFLLLSHRSQKRGVMVLHPNVRIGAGLQKETDGIQILVLHSFGQDRRLLKDAPPPKGLLVVRICAPLVVDHAQDRASVLGLMVGVGPASNSCVTAVTCPACAA